MTNQHYKELSSEVDKFFNDQLCPALVRAKEERFKELNEWLTNFHEALIKVRSAEEERYELSAKLFSEREDQLKPVIDRFFEDNRFQSWIRILENTVEILPGSVTIQQGEDRYDALEGDGAATRLIKVAKRFKRRLKGGRTDEQVVPLRLIVHSMLLDASDMAEEMAAREFEEITLLLDLLLEKPPIKDDQIRKKNGESDELTGGGKKQTGTPQTFRLDLIQSLQKNLESAKKNIEEFTKGSADDYLALLEPLKKEIRKAVEKGGTFELSLDKPQQDQLKKKSNSAEKTASGWRVYTDTQLSDLDIQLQLAMYGITADRVQIQVLEKMHLLFRDLFYIPIEQGVSHCRNVLQELGDEKKLSKKKVDEYRTRLIENLENDTVEPSGRTDAMSAVIDRIQRDVSRLQASAGKFSEKITLAEERERSRPHPRVKTDTINWRSLAARYLKDQAVNKLDPVQQRFPDLHRQIVEEVNEAVNVADMNLLAASENLGNKQSDDDPKQIALSGIERAVSVLEGAIKQVRQKQNQYEAVVKSDLPEAIRELAFKMLKRDYDRFELEDKARMVKEQATGWKKKLTVFWAVTSERAELVYRFLSRKYRAVSDPVFRFLGFRRDDEVSSRQMRSLAEYLSRSAMDENLPFIYKRLFDRYFQIDQRFYLRPKGSKTLFIEAYERWKKGLDSTVMITGEKGSGKTTMMNLIVEEFDGREEQVRLDFSDTFYQEKLLVEKLSAALGLKTTSSKEEFIKNIGRLKKKRIFMVENLQNIFIRNIHGFGALNAFWEIISATGDKIFWVVNCSRYSWAFITKMSGADQYFTHTIEVDKLDNEQVRDAILERHNATGYELEFEASEAVKNSRAFKKLLNDEEKATDYVRDQYFNRLAKVSEGNMSIAMLFWLQSIKEFDDKTFLIAPIEIADVDKLEVPSREVLFALAAFVVHDTLDAEEMAMALHQDPSASRLMIARLKAKGIIQPFENGYQMNQLLYRQVVRLLKRKNIIH